MFVYTLNYSFLLSVYSESKQKIDADIKLHDYFYYSIS